MPSALRAKPCSPFLSQLLERFVHELADGHFLRTPSLGRAVVYTFHLLANSQWDFLKMVPAPMTVTLAAGVHEIAHDIANGDVAVDSRLADNGAAAAAIRSCFTGVLPEQIHLPG